MNIEQTQNLLDLVCGIDLGHAIIVDGGETAQKLHLLKKHFVILLRLMAKVAVWLRYAALSAKNGIL